MTQAAVLATATAAALAGTAACLLVPATPTPARQSTRSPASSPVLLVLAVAGVLAAPAGLGLTLGPASVVLPAVAVGLALGVRSLVLRRRARQAAAAAADRVLEGCTVLADELRSGRPPAAALELAARTCPELAPAVRACALGADVPAALRRPGDPSLRLVAAAWQVAHRSGEGLGDALGRLAAGLRASRSTRRVVESELASARATARLLVALPALALLAGAGAGGRPWEFLIGSTAGLGCLTAGLGLGFAGLWWIEAIADGVEGAP